jgi:hypothetical protein
MQTILLKETQRIREIPFFLLIGIVQVIFLWGLIQQVIFGKPWGINPASNVVLIIINIGFLLLFIFLFSIKLEIEITHTGIHFRIFPFHFRKRFIAWNDMESLKVVRYDAIKEYLGWGIRYAPKKGWCYTISGTWGIRIKKKDGKCILIGTHRVIDYSDIFNSLSSRGVINIKD